MYCIDGSFEYKKFTRLIAEIIFIVSHLVMMGIMVKFTKNNINNDKIGLDMRCHGIYSFVIKISG